MEIIYQPRVDRELESLIERLHPPRVCIDNDSSEACTLVKCTQPLELRGRILQIPVSDRLIPELYVDSVNKHGILLEMVQVLTHLDLIISKSYISSDGGWFMDVFHVTDQFGNKLTDESLVRYIQQALGESRKEEISSEKMQLHTCRCKGPQNLLTKNTALEITGTDKPGLLSEISALLVELDCNVTSVMSWTHNDRVACIIYMQDASSSEPITDPNRPAQIEEKLETVIKGHDGSGESRGVKLTAPVGCSIHAERRLHQLMYSGRDYERCRACQGDSGGEHKKGCDGTHVLIDRCEDKKYWVVNVRSRDRPKLLFDTVCVLTDMQYDVFHAAISSKGSMADQEYFIRHQEGSTLDRESEKEKLTLCIIAAIERRVSHGLRIDLDTQNRRGLLWDVTRVFRENGLWITRVEIGTQGEKAVGSFYVTDSSGQDVSPSIVELVREKTGGSLQAVQKSPYKMPRAASYRQESKANIEERPRFSLGSMLWSQFERLSSNFGPVRS